jgi:DNA polymerase-3 subunit delta'
MSLKEIFCQDKALSILQRALAADKMPHAYIFAGAEGVGKFKTAREWAKLLLCKNPTIKKTDSEQFADSCGSCESCRLLEADSHPDFNHVYKELIQFTREGKDRKTPVDLPKDVIKEFLIEKVSTRPALSEKKVFVVSEAEKLNIASQNSLLKVLEEPPKYCTIILLCTRLERLLPTTKSRCRIIRFGPIDKEQIIDRLQEMGVEQKKAQYFARLAQGSLGQGCRWAQLELADANLYETKKELLNSLTTFEYADALELAQRLLEQSKEISTIWGKLDETTSKTDLNRRVLKTLVQIIISALHDAMRLSVTPSPSETPKPTRQAPTEDLINFDQKEQIRKLAGRFDAERSAEKIADAYKTLRWIDSNVNEKLIFEQLLLNLTASDKIKVQ